MRVTMEKTDEEEFTIKISPIKFTIDKGDKEYEFSPIGEITDLAKLKLDVIDIVKRFDITVKSKHHNVIAIPKSDTTGRSFEEDYVKAKDVIREWYREDPKKEWSSGELMAEVKFPKTRRSLIMNKLLQKEKFIRCVNPQFSRNMRRYVKAEAMVVPEAFVEKNLEKLERERKLIREG
jgi:hypothetical protein